MLCGIYADYRHCMLIYKVIYNNFESLVLTEIEIDTHL
jgi:hypothetical protein